MKIVHKKVDVSTVGSKCGSKDNMKHTPGGGTKKVCIHGTIGISCSNNTYLLVIIIFYVYVHVYMHSPDCYFYSCFTLVAIADT